MIKANFINDPGHGWLSISIKDFIAIGAPQLSFYSYVTWTRVYAEEDCDAELVINAAGNDKIRIKDLPGTNNESPIRNYSSYSQDLLLAIEDTKEKMAKGIPVPIRPDLTLLRVDGKRAYYNDAQHSSLTVLTNLIHRKLSRKD